MRARQTLPARLRRLSFVQDGIVSREQARAHGLGADAIDRLVGDQHWRALGRGVYLTADTEPSWRALAWAGVLIGGDDARLGGQAAGYLQGLVADPPAQLDVLIPHTNRVRELDPWRFLRQRTLERTYGNPPCTSVEATVLDLCQVGRPEDVVGWVTLAVQRRLSTPDRLLTAAESRARMRHRRILVDLLRDVAEGAQSPLELRYLRDVERRHGLPRGRRQVRSADRVAVRDVEYDEFSVIVELDGRAGHIELGRFRDMWRDNVATADGRLTLRYGAYDLYHRPCQIAAQVGQVLRARGWDGEVTRCVWCRLVA